MYQDIIITELDNLIQEINKSNPSENISYRIEPTKIVVDLNKKDNICDKTYRNIDKSKNKSLMCSINTSFNMNQSQNDSIYDSASSKSINQFSKLKTAKNEINIMNQHTTDGLDDTGENNQELELILTNNENK